MGVIGAGVIGLELGSVWNRLGSDVVLLEAMEDFLRLWIRALPKNLKRSLPSRALDIRLGARVTGTEIKGKEVEVTYVDADGSEQKKPLIS